MIGPQESVEKQSGYNAYLDILRSNKCELDLYQKCMNNVLRVECLHYSRHCHIRDSDRARIGLPESSIA